MKRRILTLIIGALSISAYAATLRVVPLTANELNAIAGHYSSTYGYVHVKPGKHGVFTNFNGRRISSVKKSDGHYYSTFKLIGLIPISLRMSLDKVNGLHRVSLDRHKVKKVVGQQFKPTPVPAAWTPRLGEYRATAVNGKSKIYKVKLETQQGVVLIRLNNSKYAYPLVTKGASRLVRPTIGRPRQRHMEVWPEGKSLAAIVGNIRFRLEKLELHNTE